jgi:hypothetical protein
MQKCIIDTFHPTHHTLVLIHIVYQKAKVVLAPTTLSIEHLALWPMAI